MAGMKKVVFTVLASLALMGVQAGVYEEHVEEVYGYVLHYLTTAPIDPFIKDGPATVTLAEKASDVFVIDANYHLAIVAGIISQGDAKLYASFYVMQQLAPYQPTTIGLLYTCTDASHRPSATLFSDVVNHSYMAAKRQSGKFLLHIDTLQVYDDGRYLQEWILYSPEEIKKVKVVFSPDGEGGTNFTFLE